MKKKKKERKKEGLLTVPMAQTLGTDIQSKRKNKES